METTTTTTEEAEASEPAYTAATAERYMRNLAEHKQLVGKYMQKVIAELTTRAIAHDESKWGEEEFPPYAKQLPLFEQADYGSPEYIACLRAIKPAIDHHFSVERHHPEHFGSEGINGMNLIDLVEMVCDWMAAAQRGGGSLANLRLDLQQDRFAIGSQLQGAIEHTVEALR